MSRAWWIPIVQWTVWGLVMAAVMGWVAKGRLRKRAESDARTLCHPISTRHRYRWRRVLFGIAIVSTP
jgi:hypothetical protein